MRSRGCLLRGEGRQPPGAWGGSEGVTLRQEEEKARKAAEKQAVKDVKLAAAAAKATQRALAEQEEQEELRITVLHAHAEQGSGSGSGGG